MNYIVALLSSARKCHALLGVVVPSVWWTWPLCPRWMDTSGQQPCVHIVELYDGHWECPGVQRCPYPAGCGQVCSAQAAVSIRPPVQKQWHKLSPARDVLFGLRVALSWSESNHQWEWGSIVVTERSGWLWMGVTVSTEWVSDKTGELSSSVTSGEWQGVNIVQHSRKGEQQAGNYLAVEQLRNC